VVQFKNFSRSRRALLKILTSVALLTFTDRAWGATRPPIACTRLGQKVIYRGKKYTCIKVNKKLVWDKGVPLPIASSKPSTSPSATATPTSSLTNTPKESPGAHSNSPSAPPSKTRIFFAKSTDIPSFGTVVINGKDQLERPLSVAFTRFGSTLIALEAFCTHAGCIVRPNGKELTCPCHYSVFDPESGKPGNPSQQGAYPLTRLDVVEEGGAIYLWV
jgi:Rieske Fe-S protein